MELQLTTMLRLIAFLRAINVGGHTVKMDRLRQLFEELGLDVVFDEDTRAFVYIQPHRGGEPALRDLGLRGREAGEGSGQAGGRRGEQRGAAPVDDDGDQARVRGIEDDRGALGRLRRALAPEPLAPVGPLDVKPYFAGRSNCSTQNAAPGTSGAPCPEIW